MANLTCKFYARRSSDTYIYLIIKIGIVKINDSHAYISQCFAHELPYTTRYCPLRKRTVLPAAALVAILVMTLAVTGGGAIQHAGEPWQAAALNPETYQPAGTAWSILDMATSALLPGYAFAQVQGSTPPTFDSSELHSDTGVLTITFSETIDVTPATNVIPAKIHIRESGSYTGGITLSAGELDTAAAADGATISFTLTKSHLATVAGLTTPELTIEPGAVRDTSGNPIDGTFDISTAVFVDATLIRLWGDSPTGMTFSNDGLRMFVIDGGGYDIDEYTLSAAFDASTLIHVNSTSVSTNYSTPTDMAFSNDGLKMFIVNFKERTIEEYTLSTAFDVSTLEFVRDQLVRIQEKNPTGMAFSSDGLKMFVVGFEKDSVNEYTLSAPFDLYGRVFVHAISVADQVDTPRDVAFSNDGLKMFVVDSNQDKVHEYTLSTAFDVSTAIHVDFLSVAGLESTPKGMAFSNDGAKMFVVGTGSDNVNEYTLNSVYPITVTTASATTPTLASIVRYDPVAANTGSQTLVYKATFSENVTGVDASDFALSSGSTGGTGGGTNPVTDISGLGNVYHVTVFALQNGTYNLDLVSSGHGIADAAANPLTNTTPTTGADQTYTVSIIPPDNTAPTLASIHRSSPAVENTSSQTLVYKVTFSEDVTGVNTSDFALSPDSIGGAGSANIGGNSEQFKQTRSPALAIPDMIAVSDTITVSNSGTAASVYVAVDITHAYIGDLRIDLIAPDGATRTLHNREGGSAGDLDRMYTLSFDDLLVAGTWKLQIHDGFDVYQGVLNNWTLTINYGDPPTIPVTGISGSGDVYYVTVSALQDGAYNLDLVSSGHNIADAASNSLVNTSPAGADETYTVSTTVADNTNPRLESIERYSPVTQNTDSQTLVYEVTFSEDVTGVGTDDFVLSSGSTTTADPVTSISGSGSVYYATVSASTDGTYNLDLVSSGHSITDAAANPLTNTTPTTGTDQTYTVSITIIDNTAPTLESIQRYSPVTQNTDNQTLVYEVTFSEEVTGVDTDDFVLSSGSTTTADPVTSISGSGSVYYATVFASTDGTYNLDLVSSGHDIKDTAENPLTNTVPTTGTDETYTVSTVPADSTAPTISSIQRYNPAVENTDSQTLIYEVTFSENVTGVDASDFALSPDSTWGGNTSASTGQFMQTTPHALAIPYNVTVYDTIKVSSSGTAASISVAVDITHKYIVDLKIDLIAPDGTVQTLHNRESGTPDIDQTYQPDFGSVSTAGDWILSIHDDLNPDNGVLNSWTLTIDYGDTPSPVTEVSGSGNTYYMTVPSSTDGTYNLDLVSSGHGIEDAAENPLTNTVPTTGTDQTYTVSTTVTDNTAPTLASIHRSSPAAENTGSQTLVYEVTFSEDVAGVDVSDFALSSDSTEGTGGGSSPVTDVSGSGSVYYATVSASTDGTYNLDLVSSGHNIVDAAGNSLTNTTPTTGTDQTYTVSITIIDNTAPTLASIERHSPASQNTDSQTLVYMATFSEDVTGVGTSDFVLSPDSTWGGNTSASTGQFMQTRSYVLAIPYNVTVSDTITVSGSGTAASISVAVDITHKYIVDLKIDLIAPDGTVQTLHNRESGTPDIDQTYQPDFGSVSTAGDWILSIHDDLNPDNGVLNSWTLTIDYGDTPSPVTEVSGSGNTYYMTVPSSTDGTYNLDLVSSGHGIEDAAENPLTNTVPTTGTDQTYTVSTTVTDNTAPTLASIHRSSPAAENTGSQTLVYEVTFSEDVAGVDVSDFALSSDSTEGTGGGSSPVTDVSGSGSVYYATVSASTDGTYNLDLVSSGHNIVDAAGNSLTNTTPTTGTDQTYTVSITIIDNTAPTLASIERHSPASQNTDSQTLVYMATFSEDVTGVSTSDFVLSPDSTWGGNTSASTGQFMQTRSHVLAIPYNVTVYDTIKVSSSGTAASISVAVDITHKYIVDLKIDLIAPDGTVQTLHNRESGTPDIDQTYLPDFGSVSTAGDWILSIHDDLNPDNGVLNSWTLTIDYGDTPSPVTEVSGSGNTYYMTVPSSTDGTYNLDLVSSGHGIEDAAENPLTNTVPTTGTDQTYTVSTTVTDNTAPTLASIHRSSPAAENTGSQTLVYEVTFSEDVAGVDVSDFALSSDSTEGTGGGSSPVTDVSGSGSVYYATVSASTDGTYNLDLVSSGHNIVDAAGNSLTNTTPTTGTDQTYTVSITIIDNTAPTLASIERHSPASQNTDSQTLVYMATFSEDVTGVSTSDFVLSPDSTWGGNTSASTGQFMQTRSHVLAIPYNVTVYDTIKVSSSGTAASISVAVDITHKYIVDLKIDLIAPDGTVQTLHNRESGTPDIDQTYLPDFGSVSTAGDWILSIHDDLNPDNGVLNSWTLTIDYGDTPSPVTEVSGSGNTYYMTVPSSTDGTYNLDLVSSGHGIEDAAENPLTNTVPTTGTDQTYTVSTTVTDNTAPTLASIHRSSPAAENTGSQTLVYEVTFSEDVAGVDVSDFALSSDSTEGTGGGSSPVTDVSGSGSVYYATVSASTDGTYNLDLVSSGHNIADAAGNSLTNTTPTTGTDQTYTVSITIIDNTAPTLASIERHSPASQNTDSQTLVYMATFSEDVTGVSTSDFVLSPDSTWGGNTSASTGQFMQTRSHVLAIPYNVTVSDTITVSGSGTAASISVAVDITHKYIVDLKIDLIAPDGTVQTLHNRESGTPDIDQTYQPDFGSVSTAGDWILSIHDDLNPDNGVLNSWTLTIDYGDTPSPVTEVSGSGNTYYMTVPSSTDGTYNLDLVSSGHGIEDAAENPLTNTVPTTGTDQTYTVSTTVTDNTAPTLASIHRSSPAAENTGSQTLVYEVTFSEDVAGVDVSDFALSSDSTEGTGGGSSPVTDVSGSGSVYYATVSASTDGTYNLDLVSSGHNIADAAGNSLTNTTPTTGTDQTYTVSITIIDNTAPTLASIERHSPASQNTDSQTLVYMATFSEDVTGVSTSDFVLSPDSTWGGNTSASTGQFMQTRSHVLAIPYNVTVSDTITVSGSGTAASVLVEVDITHAYIGDLKIDLIAPDGTTTKTLHDRSDGTTNNIDQMYTPDFGSVPISGVWTLQINDNHPDDSGVLNSWTLTIDYGDTPSPVTEVSGSGNTYYMTVPSSTDGTYNLDLVSSGHGIEDAAENPLTNTVPTTGTDQTYTVSTTVTDNTAPTLASLERSNPSTPNTNSQTLVYRVAFSESVTGVDTDDFVLSSDSVGGGNNNNNNAVSSELFTQTRSPLSPITNNNGNSSRF